ncbi:protein FAM169B-like isoform X2 [Zootermopsis nevadensis]|uniref:N-acetyltransferase domain-containing protein n=1 Tax=Zootermopsis nevadensis TaxID=136037 RepID=A0A067QXL1_ZOONE|nr:protein FAM169B-like isoform X2 [Zootermopsis nevadensis]KDR14138.1 hypothetical protein L798_11776 [Zootermopsis nevadensis]
MQCSRCSHLMSISNEHIADMHLGYSVTVKQLNCSSCNNCVALGFNDTWCTPQDILADERERNGWFEVSTPRDRVVYYTLSQVIYREFEVPDGEQGEAIFDQPDPTDIIMVLWLKGQAIGFYTIKPKGSLVEETMEHYAMHTLDTAYVWSVKRRQGYGMGMLQNITSSYPGKDIGFSKPISFSMWKVLRKYLQHNADYRNKFWEIEGTGGEGNQKLIWYAIRLQDKEKESNT